MKVNRLVLAGCFVLLVSCTGLAEPDKTPGAQSARPHEGQESPSGRSSAIRD